ncbi:glycosyltransferase [Xanthobacter pseudotagetidis]|uniref:glycosyltransferase n=1 Tax=Xanthobacter pseudotagetidis TaxID=3119911 RepID=UPI0037264102
MRCNRANCPDSISKPCWLHGAAGGGRPFGVDLFGYLLSEIGLGEAARLLVGALDAAAIPNRLINFPLVGRQAESLLARRIVDHGGHALALTVSGAMDIPAFASRACRGQENIHYTYWELPSVPGGWRQMFDGFDSYWAPTTFVRDMLMSVQKRPVHLVPQPVLLPAAPPAVSRSGGPLRVLTLFDYDSYLVRKNPHGAVAAFLAAFPVGTEDVELVIKARGRGPSNGRDTISRLAKRDRRVRLIDRTIPRNELDALTESCDVFMSLHRSEGFSLGCAEALALGKAVVATDFGGTRDFVTQETGFPVRFQPVLVGADDYPGAEGSHWAEPDIEHAAATLRSIYDDPSSVAPKARAGYALLKRNNSLQAVGARIRDLIDG